MVTAAPRLLSIDPAVIKLSADAGAGIGQVPRILAQDELANGSLVEVLPEWVVDEVDIDRLSGWANPASTCRCVH
nr:hypothetical protein FNV92_11360 [Bradyrhizobium cosmicum]